MKKRLFCLVLAPLLTLSGCSGCGAGGAIAPASPEEGVYSTLTPMTAMEYNIYMGKQITVFVNQLTTHIVMLRNGAAYENEASLARDSLATMQAAYDGVIVTMPARTAEDDREGLIAAMGTAISHMEGLVGTLEEGGDASGYADDFRNDNTALTAYANLYYQ